MVFKAGYIYILTTHWLACFYFIIHRYFELSSKLTFAVADNLAMYNEDLGMHDICSVFISRCYSRTIYFVLGTLTSIGYGDIMPYGNFELAWEIAVSLLGCFVAALFSAYCSSYLKDLAATGDISFKKKLNTLKKYIKFREIDESLAKSIIRQYAYLWNSHRSLGEESTDLLSDLSEPTRLDIAYEINKSLVDSMSIFHDRPFEVKRRFAAIMKPQVLILTFAQ
jgi:hypothetical protein